MRATKAIDFATSQFPTVSPDANVAEVIEIMTTTVKDYVVIKDGEKLQGVIPIDVIVAGFARDQISRSTKARELMRELPVLNEDVEVEEVARHMRETNCYQVLIGGKIIDTEVILRIIKEKSLYHAREIREYEGMLP